MFCATCLVDSPNLQLDPGELIRVCELQDGCFLPTWTTQPFPKKKLIYTSSAQLQHSWHGLDPVYWRCLHNT